MDWPVAVRASAGADWTVERHVGLEERGPCGPDMRAKKGIILTRALYLIPGRLP